MEEKEQTKNIKFNDSQREIGQKSDKVLIQTSKSEMVSNSEIIKYEECPERWFNLVA